MKKIIINLTSSDYSYLINCFCVARKTNTDALERALISKLLKKVRRQKRRNFTSSIVLSLTKQDYYLLMNCISDAQAQELHLEKERIRRLSIKVLMQKHRQYMKHLERRLQAA